MFGQLRSPKSRSVVLAAAAIVVASLASAGIAQAGPEEQAPMDQQAASAEAAPPLPGCRGGAQEGVNVVTNDASVLRRVGGLIDLPGAIIARRPLAGTVTCSW